MASVVHSDVNNFKYINIVWFCSHWLAMSNSAVNPFVYFFCHDKFKKEFQNRFKWCFPGGGGGGGAAGGTVGAGGHRGGGGGGRRGGGGKRRWVAKLRYFVSPCFVLLPFLKKGFFVPTVFSHLSGPSG